MIVQEDDTIAFIDFGAVDSIDDNLKRNTLEFFYAINNLDVEGATQSFLKIGSRYPECGYPQAQERYG